MKPVLQALLVADHVYSDAVTGKKIIAGIFHRLWFKKTVPQDPAEQGNQAKLLQVGPGGHHAGSPFCYVSLTDVHGDQQFELRYVDLAHDNAIFGTKFGVQSTDPLQTIEIILPLPMLPAAKTGTFALELLWNEEPLGSHRINIDEMKEEDKS